MWKGCVLWLVIFAAASGFEWWWLPATADPIRWQLSIALGFLITLVASNLWGLWHAFARMRMAGKDPARWRHGEMVALSGEVRPMRQSLKAPISGRDVVAYHFEVYRVEQGTGKNSSSRTISELQSFGMTPCGIYTQSGMMRLNGFPMLAGFPRTLPPRDMDHSRAASFLATKRWTRRKGVLNSAGEHLRSRLMTPDTHVDENYIGHNCDLPLDIVDEDAPPNPKPPAPMPPDQVQLLSERMMIRQMRTVETLMEAGTNITAFGVFRQDLMAVDVTSGIFDTDRAVFPGLAGKVVGQLIIKALIVLILMTTITVAAHHWVSVDNGENVQRLVDFIG